MVLMPQLSKASLRVMILEDDYFQAQDLAAQVEDLGGEVSALIASAAEAMMSLASETPPTVALVDLELRDGTSLQVADLLLSHGVRLAMMVSHGRRPLPERYARVPQLDKPVMRTELAAFLGRSKA